MASLPHSPTRLPHSPTRVLLAPASGACRRSLLLSDVQCLYRCDIHPSCFCVLCEALWDILQVFKMLKGTARGRSKGKTSARRRLPLESSPVTSRMAKISHLGPSGIPCRPVPLNLDPPTTPQLKIPPPLILYKEGDTFCLVIEKYSGWKGSCLTPRKRELLYYTLFYHDDEDSDIHVSGDKEKDGSIRKGIEGASEILQESGCEMGEKCGVTKKVGAKKKLWLENMPE